MKHLAIWRKMELLQEDINEILEPYNLSDTAQDMYVHIGAFHYTCIASIRRHKYFKNKSFLTSAFSNAKSKFLSVAISCAS